MTNQNLSVGDNVTVSLYSTSGRKLEIIKTDMTAEVEGEVTGKDYTERARVPAAVGVDNKGELHAIVLWEGIRWLGVYHRRLNSCREWETMDGELINGELREIVDKALANDNC